MFIRTKKSVLKTTITTKRVIMQKTLIIFALVCSLESSFARNINSNKQNECATLYAEKDFWSETATVDVTTKIEELPKELKKDVSFAVVKNDCSLTLYEGNGQKVTVKGFVDLNEHNFNDIAVSYSCQCYDDTTEKKNQQKKSQ